MNLRKIAYFHEPQKNEIYFLNGFSEDMKGLQGIIFILTLLSVTHLVSCQGYLPQVTPFFFLCNYHGNVQDVGRQGGEVKLSVSIEGNPDNYIPGQVYQGKLTFELPSSCVITMVMWKM